MARNKLCTSLFVLVLLIAMRAAAQESRTTVIALPQAHAHNDYHHARPLLDALAHGFCSVEADVFLVDGKLFVGHSRSELKPERTLQELYLDPLRRRVDENGGRVYRDGPPLTLLIDIKSDGEETYTALAKVLAQYSRILTSVHKGQLKTNAVTVVISGNRAKERIAADSPRYATVDGRLSDLDTNLPPRLMPLISDNWSKHFRWQGKGPMSTAEKKKLRQIVEKVHRAGRRVRFWAAPENTAVWNELYDAGVDLINTDDLDALQRFLLHKARPGDQQLRDSQPEANTCCVEWFSRPLP
jgi:hypothetical protein